VLPTFTEADSENSAESVEEESVAGGKDDNDNGTSSEEEDEVDEEARQVSERRKRRIEEPLRGVERRTGLSMIVASLLMARSARRGTTVCTPRRFAPRGSELKSC